MSRASPEIIRDLQERLRQMERSQRPAKEPIFSSAWFLANRPLEWGTLIEWLDEGEGSGSAALAMAVAAGVLQQGGAFVVIDGRCAGLSRAKAATEPAKFYPPAAAALGIPLERSVIVRPGTSTDALWALEQSLRCGAAAVVLGRVAGLKDAALRRLQLAAETGGSLGFLLRPVRCRAEPSWAEMRLLVRPMPTAKQFAAQAASVRTLRVEVLHCRGGASGEIVEVELSDETGHVCLASRLANPAFPAGAAGA